jgi:enamine deaminase RidA (YjgF/YER057c/UK114 family)
VTYIEGAPGTGMSSAVVIDDLPLVHTAQVFASGPAAQPPKGSADAQLARTFENLESALAAAGANLDSIVRLNINLAEDGVRPAAEKALARRFRGKAKPVVTFVTGALRLPGAVVAMDAVAAVSGRAARTGEVTTHVSRALPGEPRETHAAVLPVGPTLFVSGRAARGESREGARATMDQLDADLKLLELTRADIVQVKAFVSPGDAAEDARAGIRDYFGDAVVPPLVFVQWATAVRQVEIELVVAAGTEAAARERPIVEYITPPTDRANPSFTRLVRVNRGKFVYMPGYFGAEGQAPDAQLRGIFAQMRDTLSKAGSDFEHLAKATYYTTDDATAKMLGPARAEVFNPKRPPASSALRVVSTSRAGATATVDMIAVAP